MIGKCFRICKDGYQKVTKYLEGQHCVGARETFGKGEHFESEELEDS